MMHEKGKYVSVYQMVSVCHVVGVHCVANVCHGFGVCCVVVNTYYVIGAHCFCQQFFNMAIVVHHVIVIVQCHVVSLLLVLPLPLHCPTY